MQYCGAKSAQEDIRFWNDKSDQENLRFQNDNTSVQMIRHDSGDFRDNTYVVHKDNHKTKYLRDKKLKKRRQERKIRQHSQA